MKNNKQSNKKDASALVTVILTIAILSLLAGAFVSNVNNRRLTVSQASTWQEALIAAEAGAHEGIARVEQSLVQNGQTLLPANIANVAVTLNHGGEGTTTASAAYSLEGNIPGYRNYYRIVSTGKVDLPGGQFLSMDGRDAVVRKLNLQDNVSGAPLRTATRTVEAWLQPVYSGTGSAGLRTEGSISLNNHNIFIDSFDSTNLARSYGGVLPGQPYPAGNQNTGMGYFNVAPYDYLAANISTNSASISGGNAFIYGDAYTNGGTQQTIVGAGNIQGNLYDDYYEPMAPVYAPQWTVGTYTSGIPVTTTNNGGRTTTSYISNVNSSATITGGTAANPARYIISSISLSGGKQVTFDFGKTGSTQDLTKSYIEIYATGDISTRGNGTTDGSIVIVAPVVNVNDGKTYNVNVKMFVGGNLTFAGNGLVNNNNTAASLSIQGITPTAPATQQFKLGGSAIFYGTVYAPGASLVLNGGGNGGQFVGSLAGMTASLVGNVQIRYDESLGQSQQDTITSFKLASWFEDTRSWPEPDKQSKSWLRPF